MDLLPPLSPNLPLPNPGEVAQHFLLFCVCGRGIIQIYTEKSRCVQNWQITVPRTFGILKPRISLLKKIKLINNTLKTVL